MGALVAAAEAMRSAVVRALPAALASGGRLVGFYAKANHPYTNRTFRLQTNTKYQATEGSFASGYRVRVHGNTFYGSYVEEGTRNEDGSQRTRPYPYLAPAWQHERDTVAEIVAASMVGAIERLP